MNQEPVPRPHVGQPRPAHSHGHAPEDDSQSRIRDAEGSRASQPPGDTKPSDRTRRDDSRSSPDRDSSSTKQER